MEIKKNRFLVQYRVPHLGSTECDRHLVTKIQNSAVFPRSARLLTPKAFAAVFEKRGVRRGFFFHLHVGPGHAPVSHADGTRDLVEPLSVPRLGIAVPKKLLNAAVHRNLVKRIARETFRHVRHALDGRDYVLRLAVKLDPRRQPLNRKALAHDIQRLLNFRRTNVTSPATTNAAPTRASLQKE